MSEMTTIEKIEQMLAWLDEGTPAQWDAIVFENDEYDGRPLVSWTIMTVETYPADSVNNLTVASGYGGLSEGFARLDQGAANARNIAALLNGARPMLEAALQAWTLHSGETEHIEDASHESIAAIIAPLYKAFEEARDAQ